MVLTQKTQYRLWLACLILGIPLAVFAAFGRALVQGFAPIDDILLVTQNLAAHGFTWEHVKLAFTTFDPELYIPLTLVSFQIDYSIAWLAPQMFHLTNLILHALNGILVALLLKKLTGSTWGSLLGGLLFAIHPLNTEAAVWISGRKDVLFACFGLLSLLFWTDRQRGNWRTSLSLIFLLLALLTKVTAVIVLPLMVLIDWYVGRFERVKRDETDKRVEREKTGKRSSSLFFHYLLSLLNLSTLFTLLATYLPSVLLCLTFGLISLGGKERVLGSQPIIEVIFTGFRSIWFYISQFVLPTGLSISHEWVGGFSFANGELWAGIALTMGMTWLAWHWRDRTRALTFGWAWFLLALAPTFLGSRKGGMLLFAVDRYGYVPLIGLIFLCVMLGLWITERWNARIATGIAIVVIAILTFASRQQTKTWDSPEALFGKALTVTPNSVGSRVSLAQVLLQAGKTKEAFGELKEGLKYGDDIELNLTAGQVYAQAGDTASAREQFAIILNKNPKNPDALFALGSIDEQKENFDSALAHYRKAVEYDPSFVSAHNGIARISLQREDDVTAEAELALALKWNPSSAETHRLLGLHLEQTKDYVNAEKHLRTTLELRGDSADVLLALARVLYAQNKNDKAKAVLEKILRADPRNREATEIQKQLQ